MTQIPFNRPSFVGKEEQYLAEAAASSTWAGDGAFTRRCSAFLEDHLGAARVLLTTSCTHALEMSSLLLGLGPEDEVVIPAFTFVSTANAFLLSGAKVVFCDVRPDTLNLDENALAAVLTDRTRAVVPVHYAGVACEMDEIEAQTKPRGIAVVEDNAHGLFGSYRGRPLGTLGALATQSFHETKNFSCGEGGALVINDPALVERAEIIREKGTDRSRFFRGEVAKYTWVDLGSSFLPSDLLAAILLGQLEARDQIQTRRKTIWDRYDAVLRPWGLRNGVQTPHVPDHCDQTYHIYYLLLPSLQDRQDFIARLRDRGIHSVFHYLPLHLSEMGARLGGHEGQYPVTEDISDRLVRLPLFNSMTEREVDEVLDAITSGH